MLLSYWTFIQMLQSYCNMIVYIVEGSTAGLFLHSPFYTWKLYKNIYQTIEVNMIFNEKILIYCSVYFLSKNNEKRKEYNPQVFVRYKYISIHLLLLIRIEIKKYTDTTNFWHGVMDKKYTYEFDPNWACKHSLIQSKRKRGRIFSHSIFIKIFLFHTQFNHSNFIKLFLFPNTLASVTSHSKKNVFSHWATTAIKDSSWGEQWALSENHPWVGVGWWLSIAETTFFTWWINSPWYQFKWSFLQVFIKLYCYIFIY